ncbi:MAG TPA: glycosyltransferase [Candidatus Fermentibacter sp.]|nr:glycosyltransferase [Candidatus Fermentibacter sp.]
MTRITAVIPSWNGLHLLADCIPPLLDDGRRLDLRVIVVDDGSSDGTVDSGPGLFPGVRFVPNAGPRGFCHSVNTGAAVADDGLLLLLNNDVIVPPDSIQGIADALESSPDHVLAVMPRIMRGGEDESLLGCGFRLGLAMTLSGSGTAYPSGACSMFRTGQWRALGGLDTRYAPMYWEDVDLGLRASAAGMEVRRAEGFRVLHRHAASAGHGTAMRRMRERNRFILMDAHFRSRRIETAAFLPFHAASSLARGRTEFVAGWLDYLKWRRNRAR